MTEKDQFSVLTGLAALALVVCAALSLGASNVHAEEFGHHHGGWWHLFGGVVQPSQRPQIETIMSNEKPTLHKLFGEVEADRTALTTKLLSPGASVDVTKEVSQLKQAEGALLEEQMKIAVQVRGVLSPQQLAQANDLFTKLHGLHEQERALLEQTHEAGPED